MPDSRPNILFAIADDWSFGHAGAYGCRWVRTPAFDRVAAEGLLFTRAYTPSAKCAPSRASILTGRNPWQLEAAANHGGHFPVEFPTFPEALAAAGYCCGLTGKGWAPGVALTRDGAPRELIGTAFDARRADCPTPDIADNDYAANFEDFLSAGTEGRPWLFWYGSLEPHRGYEFGSGHRLGGKRVGDIDRVPAIWPDVPEVRHDLLDYAFECEHYDRHVGRMLEHLDRLGLADNTLVVVTSDHGMAFPRVKGQAYDLSNHMPLAVRWPRGIRRPGRRLDDFVSFIDLAPTLLQAAGVDWAAAGMKPSAGSPLQPLFEAEKDGRVDESRDHVLVGKERHDVGRPKDLGYPIRGLREGDWLYLVNFAPERWPAGNPETGYLNCDGGPTKTAVLRTRADPGRRHYWDRSFGHRPAEELYDVSADPDCLLNLASHPEQRDRCADFRARLHRRLLAQGDPRAAGQPDYFDQFPPVMPGWAGFYERWRRGEADVPHWVNLSDFEHVD